jgi:hypothetical protein
LLLCPTGFAPRLTADARCGREEFWVPLWNIPWWNLPPVPSLFRLFMRWFSTHAPSLFHGPHCLARNLPRIAPLVCPEVAFGHRFWNIRFTFAARYSSGLCVISSSSYIACSRSSGEFQVLPSCPGVLFPPLLVTRLTAKAAAAQLVTIDLCRPYIAFLPSPPSTACTASHWSFLTISYTLLQSMPIPYSHFSFVYSLLFN